MISEKNQILVNKILNSIDWGLIYKFYKILGRTVGQETIQIPGLKKLGRSVKLKKDHIKEEVRSLIYYLIENDLPQFVYGPWNFTWINGEWEIETNENEFVPILESVLEVSFSPMVVIGKEINTSLIENDELEETIDLQKQLEKAIAEENYELAAKIKDLIEIYKNKNETKI